MSIDLSGADKHVRGDSITIKIAEDHPLVRLAQSLPWETLLEPVVTDIKNSTNKGLWFMGRKIKLRMHLGAFLLQLIYNLTDRKLEYQIKDNAAFQLFCGSNIVEKWHAPDHTKIEDFRNRLTPETQRLLANSICVQATKLGFGDPRQFDIDSTVQEAGIAYPSDARLMYQLTKMGKTFTDFIRETFQDILPKDLNIDSASIGKIARKYFFLAKNKSIEVKREIFKELHKTVKKQLRPLIQICEDFSEKDLKQLPWNIRNIAELLKDEAWRYLLDVGHFTRTNTIKTGKLLSFHAKKVACVKKGKIGKEFEFGRVFQLGRIGGNFMVVQQSNSILMNDKKSFRSFIKEHVEIFGEGVLDSVAADKGYWSSQNRKDLLSFGIGAEGLQRPANIKTTEIDQQTVEDLQNRRSGIEPLIGHIKQGGQMGKSRMKSDSATLAAGYGSVLGFNLRQMIRHQSGKLRKLG